jgi:hypothetical protein
MSNSNSHNDSHKEYDDDEDFYVCDYDDWCLIS